MIASTTSLVEYVKQEMEAYRLYTVLPYLVKFIDNLTNVYVRFNRKRMKGANGTEDAKMALAVTFDVLMTLCKVMAPFTPYLTEFMYKNLNKCLTKENLSVHWELFPDPQKRQKADEKIQRAVERMQKVIEYARVIRDRQVRPTKLPLKEMTVVHPDQEYLEDVTGELQVYLSEEINVRTIKSSADVAKFCTPKAMPDWGALGKRLGKDMGKVAKGIKGLDAAAISEFETQGEITIEGHVLTAGDINITREFQIPEGADPKNIDAAGDGDVLVILDLKLDEELLAAGTAREVVNRVQKLRKKGKLELSDKVDIFYKIGDKGLDKVFASKKDYFTQAFGVAPKPVSERPAYSVTLIEEECQVGPEGSTFVVILARPAVVPLGGLLDLCGGDKEASSNLLVWLSSLSLSRMEAGQKLSVHLDGKDYSLSEGEHFLWSNFSR